MNENQSENSLTVEIDFIDGTSISIPRGDYEGAIKKYGGDAIKARQELQSKYAPKMPSVD